MARPKCGTNPLYLFAFFSFTKEGGERQKKTPPNHLDAPSPFTATSCILIQTGFLFTIRLFTKKREVQNKTKQSKSCGFLFGFLEETRCLPMWINLHQVAYLGGGISTTFPTLLEMLTPSNLSLLYARYSHLIKTSACTRHTEQRRKKKSLSRKHLP
jgi:hypothetical protein